MTAPIANVATGITQGTATLVYDGGTPGDWSKITSTSRTAKDGPFLQTHW